jgi:hypothetical protein
MASDAFALELSEQLLEKRVRAIHVLFRPHGVESVYGKAAF